jgi:hypothetical protein
MFWLHPQCLRPDKRQQGVAEDPGIGVRLAQDLHSVGGGVLVQGEAD